MALSGTRSIARRRAAATLWSNQDATTGLTRLRNTLHDLRKHFGQAGVHPLELAQDTISLRGDAVSVEIDQALAQGTGPLRHRSEFLRDMEGVDPAFDRWLTRIRDEYRQGAPVPGGVAAAERGLSDHASFGPSVVVTPFEAIGTPADSQVATAFADAVTAALARFRWFTTIVQDAPRPPASAGADGLAAYALVGSLRRSAGQCRFSLRLIALGNSGAVVWTMSFLQEDQPTFEAQEKRAAAVAARLDCELLLVEAERQQRRPPRRHDSAYSLVLQAIPAIYRLERDPFLGAGHVLEQAVIADGESALAHSWLAYWSVFFVGQGWATNRLQAMTKGGQAAERAMMLDPKDARAATVAGHVKAFLSRRVDEASVLHDLALQLNPALPLAWHFSGMTHAYAGRLDRALQCISECLDLAPAAPHGFFAEGALCIVLLLQQDHEAAVTIGRRVTERHPQFTSALKSYLAALGHLGRRAEAAEVRQRLLLLEPGFSLRRFQAASPYQRPRDIAHFSAGLRLAGLP